MPSHIIHPIPPVFDADSRILILGSFPSVKSRESCFFYGHPQNRFWKLLARLRRKTFHPPSRKRRNFCCGTTSPSGTPSIAVPSKDPATFHPRCCSKRPRLYPGSRFHPGDLTQTAGCPEKCTTASAVNRLALRQSNCRPPALPTLPGTSTG